MAKKKRGNDIMGQDSAQDIFNDIANGVDRYRAMAAQRFMKPHKDVSDEERHAVKYRFLEAVYAGAGGLRYDVDSEV